MTCIVGVDPGNSGAFAFLDPERNLMRIVDMPTFTFETTRKRVKVDPFTIVREMTSQPVANLYLEEVNASPQMGVVSAFSFGEGKGIILGAAAAMGIPTTQVKPTEWKKQMRVPADKRAAVQRASQLFPAVADLFKGPRGGVFDGRAEAALIALFGAMELGRAPTAPVTLWEISNEQGRTV
ncbi:putative RNaseH-like domain protein [Ruegeria phage vB_RpoS-V10]|nr:putative RNaseH-like domain protein [Roseobacter phage DSS3P8]AWY09327.1 putative RNaseH-like domain protein [Ruegeria phage vB_RpoS-V10]